MGSSLPRATDSYAVIRADSRRSGGFLVTNLVTGSRYTLPTETITDMLYL